MSRKKLVYLALLGIAVTAFLADRLLLTHTQTVEAAPAKSQNRHPDMKVAKVAPPKTTTLDPSLSWLEKLTDVGLGHDAFSPSWLHPKSAQTPGEGSDDLGPAPGSPEAFESAHKLQATTVIGTASLAVVDQKCLRIGDLVDGFKLTRVQPDKVEFRKGTEKAVLTLPTPPEPTRPIGTVSAHDGNRRSEKRTTTQPAFSWNQLLGLLAAPQAD